MLHTINVRVERQVIRLEGAESRRFSTVPSTMLIDRDGLIIRAGIRQQEWDEITTSDEVVLPAHLKFVHLFDEEKSATLCAQFLHHVIFEFLQQLRDESGGGFWFSDRVACNIELIYGDEAFRGTLAEELRSIPMFQSCSINGAVHFEKGLMNRPIARIAKIILGVALAAALVIVPLFAIDAALDGNPTWRRAFLLGLAATVAFATVGFIVYERKRGRAGIRSLVFVSAIAVLALARLLSEAFG